MILFNHDYCLVLAFLILQIRDIGCEDNGYYIYVSREVTAQVGLCVHIPCTFTVPHYKTISSSARGLWYRPQAFRELVAANYDQSRRRMFFTGEVPKGDCSLFINDVRIYDDDTYQFRLEDHLSNIWYSYFNVKPHLKVTGLTDKPEISTGKLLAGKQTTITCKSPGTCAGSAPVITWTGKHGELLNYEHSYTNFTSVYFSNITFTPSKEDNGSALVCRAAFLQNTAATEQRTYLNVEYPPDVTITIGDSFTRPSPPRAAPPGSPASATDDTSILKEGDTKLIYCTVDSNPSAEITWFVGDEVKKGPTQGQTLIYSLDNISPSDAGEYLCMGMNDHGTSNRTIEIIVHYSPRTPNVVCSMTEDCTVDEQHILYVMENSTFSLLCTAESLPEASLSWVTTVPSTNRTGANGDLTLYDVSLSDEGQFTCVASNSYGKSESSVNIKVTYKPRTVAGKNSSCWTHGSRIECSCIIQSFPNANIKWKIDEKLYPSNYSDKELNIFTMALNSVTNSTLTITSSRTNIRAIQCMSSNQHGSLELLLLDYTQSSSSTEIISAISCVVVIVLLLIGGFFVMHHFRKKRSSKEPDDKKEIKSDDCNVIYTNSEVQLYGNQTKEIGTISKYSEQDDKETSLYMNVEDVHYAAINFLKLNPKKAPENTEIEYAEIRK